MKLALPAAVLLAFGLQGCIRYEYEHEFWLRVDGTGTVYVTGQPELWGAFKGLAASEDSDALSRAARALFERSGLRVRRVRVTRRQGRPYLHVAADFEDVNRLSRTPAFPDLEIALRKQDARLVLEGSWARPPSPARTPVPDRSGLLAVRFHLPSKVHDHKNAAAGVERGNIVSWREDVAAALEGRALDFGATLDARSILWSTVGLFAGAIAAAILLIGASLVLVVRAGRKRAGATAS